MKVICKKDIGECINGKIYSIKEENPDGKVIKIYNPDGLLIHKFWHTSLDIYFMSIKEMREHRINNILND